MSPFVDPKRTTAAPAFLPSTHSQGEVVSCNSMGERDGEAAVAANSASSSLIDVDLEIEGTQGKPVSSESVRRKARRKRCRKKKKSGVKEWGEVGAAGIVENLDTEELGVVESTKESEAYDDRGFGDSISASRRAASSLDVPTTSRVAQVEVPLPVPKSFLMRSKSVKSAKSDASLLKTNRGIASTPVWAGEAPLDEKIPRVEPIKTSGAYSESENLGNRTVDSWQMDEEDSREARVEMTSASNPTSQLSKNAPIENATNCNTNNESVHGEEEEMVTMEVEESEPVRKRGRSRASQRKRKVVQRNKKKADFSAPLKPVPEESSIVVQGSQNLLSAQACDSQTSVLEASGTPNTDEEASRDSFRSQSRLPLVNAEETASSAALSVLELSSGQESDCSDGGGKETISIGRRKKIKAKLKKAAAAERKAALEAERKRQNAALPTSDHKDEDGTEYNFSMGHPVHEQQFSGQKQDLSQMQGPGYQTTLHPGYYPGSDDHVNHYHHHHQHPQHYEQHHYHPQQQHHHHYHQQQQQYSFTPNAPIQYGHGPGQIAIYSHNSLEAGQQSVQRQDERGSLSLNHHAASLQNPVLDQYQFLNSNYGGRVSAAVMHTTNHHSNAQEDIPQEGNVYLDMNEEAQRASNSLSLEILVHDLAQALPNPDTTSPRQYTSPKSFSTSSSSHDSDGGNSSVSPRTYPNMLAAAGTAASDAAAAAAAASAISMSLNGGSSSSGGSGGASQGYNQHLHGRSMSWSTYQGMVSHKRNARTASHDSSSSNGAGGVPLVNTGGANKMLRKFYRRYDSERESRVSRAIAMAEAERDRRISEQMNDDFQERVERARRLEWAIKATEQERRRQISRDKHFERRSTRRRNQHKKLAIKLEETERNLRIKKGANADIVLAEQRRKERAARRQERLTENASCQNDASFSSESEYDSDLQYSSDYSDGSTLGDFSDNQDIEGSGGGKVVGRRRRSKHRRRSSFYDDSAFSGDYEVVCPYTILGCDHTGRRSKIDEHLDICQYRAKSADVIDEGRNEEYKSLYNPLDHVVKCPYAVVGCEHRCTRADLPEHLLQCAYQDDDPILVADFFKELDPEADFDLGSYEVVCPYATMGCQEVILRSEVPRHLAVCRFAPSTRQEEEDARLKNRMFVIAAAERERERRLALITTGDSDTKPRPRADHYNALLQFLIDTRLSTRVEEAQQSTHHDRSSVCSGASKEESVDDSALHGTESRKTLPKELEEELIAARQTKRGMPATSPAHMHPLMVNAQMPPRHATGKRATSVAATTPYSPSPAARAAFAATAAEAAAASKNAEFHPTTASPSPSLGQAANADAPQAAPGIDVQISMPQSSSGAGADPFLQSPVPLSPAGRGPTAHARLRHRHTHSLTSLGQFLGIGGVGQSGAPSPPSPISPVFVRSSSSGVSPSASLNALHDATGQVDVASVYQNRESLINSRNAEWIVKAAEIEALRLQVEKSALKRKALDSGQALSASNIGSGFAGTAHRSTGSLGSDLNRLVTVGDLTVGDDGSVSVSTGSSFVAARGTRTLAVLDMLSQPSKPLTRTQSCPTIFVHPMTRPFRSKQSGSEKERRRERMLLLDAIAAVAGRDSVAARLARRRDSIYSESSSSFDLFGSNTAGSYLNANSGSTSVTSAQCNSAVEEIFEISADLREELVHGANVVEVASKEQSQRDERHANKSPPRVPPKRNRAGSHSRSRSHGGGFSLSSTGSVSHGSFDGASFTGSGAGDSYGPNIGDDASEGASYLSPRPGPKRLLRNLRSERHSISSLDPLGIGPPHMLSLQTHMYEQASLLNRRLHTELVNLTVECRVEVAKFSDTIQDIKQRIAKGVSLCTGGYEPRVEVFGSFATGLAVPELSDVDLVVFTNERHNDGAMMCRILGRVFANQAWIKELKVLDRAKMPVIKLVGQEHQIHVDLTFASPSHAGLATAAFVTSLMQQYDGIAQPLIYFLKKLLAKKALGDPFTGGLGSYALVLMVVASLNKSAVKIRRRRATSVGGVDDDVGVLPADLERDYPLGSLLMDFLQYYGKDFDTRQDAIIFCLAANKAWDSGVGSGEGGSFGSASFGNMSSTSTGAGPIPPRNTEIGLKHTIRIGKRFQARAHDPHDYNSAALVVEDPIQPGNNVASTCFRFLDVQRALADLYAKLLSCTVRWKMLDSEQTGKNLLDELLA